MSKLAISPTIKRITALSVALIGLANFMIAAPPASALWLLHKPKKGAPVPQDDESAEPKKDDGAEPENNESAASKKDEESASSKEETSGDISKKEDASEGEEQDEMSEKKEEAPGLDLSRTEFPTAEDAPHGSTKIPDNGGLPDYSTKDPKIYYTLAKKLTAEKKYKEALQAVNKALVFNSHYWDAIYQGAYILQVSGREDEAIKNYKILVGRKPDYVSAQVNLGILLKKKGNYAEAEEHFKKAIDINFYSLEPHYNLANVYIQQGKLEEALHQLKACLKLSPSNAWVHNNLGVIYQRRHYLEEAEEEFLRALNLEPANKTFEQNLSMVRTQLKKKPTRA